jgi:acetolactate synthase-1/2/3 large subunit
MTGAQALVRSLQREGIQVVFGIPTAGQYEAVDALWETPQVRYISVRHEQAAAYMADGYARAGGRIAGAIVAPGPGLLNAMAAMATASDACSPMLVVTNSWRFDDAPIDQSWWPMARWTAQLDRPADIPGVVRQAMRRMKTELPGPVLLQLETGTLARIEDVELLEPEVYHPPAVEAGLLRQAAQLLLEAETPAIWAGGGVHRADASRALLAIAEHLQAPVVTSPAGKGAISDRHPLSLGLGERRYAPLEQWLGQRDVILAVGTKTSFHDRPPGQRVVRIDIDELSVAADDRHDIGIVADAQVCLVALCQALRAHPPVRRDDSVSPEITALLEERFAEHNQLEPQRSFIDAIRDAVPDDGVIVQGMNQMGYYSRNYLPMYESRTYLTGSHHGTLGHSFPLGLGAKIARPDAPVVVLAGDGGFLYNSQELATAVQYGVNVVVIVFNDNAYGNPRRSQIEEYDGHVLGTELHNPDFVALARTYGARGVLAGSPEELGKAVEEALVVDATTLIEVPVGPMMRVY